MPLLTRIPTLRNKENAPKIKTEPNFTQIRNDFLGLLKQNKNNTTNNTPWQQTNQKPTYIDKLINADPQINKLLGLIDIIKKT